MESKKNVRPIYRHKGDDKTSSESGTTRSYRTIFLAATLSGIARMANLGTDFGTSIAWVTGDLEVSLRELEHYRGRLSPQSYSGMEMWMWDEDHTGENPFPRPSVTPTTFIAWSNNRRLCDKEQT